MSSTLAMSLFKWSCSTFWLIQSSSLHYPTLHYTTSPRTTLHYTTLPYTTLHYTTSPRTTLHYTTPPCTTLHCWPIDIYSLSTGVQLSWSRSCTATQVLCNCCALEVPMLTSWTRCTHTHKIISAYHCVPLTFFFKLRSPTFPRWFTSSLLELTRHRHWGDASCALLV